MTSRENLAALQHKYALLEEEAARLREENLQLRDARRSQKQLEYLIETSFDPMWISDEDGTIKTVNRAFLELVGCFSVDEVFGKHIWDFSVVEEGVYASTSGEQVVIDWAYFESLTEHAAALIDQGKCSNWKFYFYNKTSGKVVPATQNIVFLYGDQGQPMGSFGIIHDLTGIRTAEHRIERARGFLENVFDTVGDGLLVTDTTGTIILANRCFAGMLGHADEDLKGRFIYELLPPRDETEMKVPRVIEILLEEGTLRGYETAYKSRDGSTVEVELNMTCLRKDDGTLNGIVSSIRDITERRLAEAALRDSEEKYRSLVENLTIGVFRSKIDKQGTIIHANPGLAKMAGFASAEAMLGASITAFYENPDDRSAVLHEIITQGGLRGREILFRKPNGDVRWGSISVTLLHDKDGMPVCLDGVIEDITERKQAAEFLQRSHEKLEAMVRERTVELQEANTALRILLRTRQDDAARMEETMLFNIQKLVAPSIEKLKTLGPSNRARACLDVISETVSHIAEPLLRGKSPFLLNLTASELQIVNLIKQRKSTRAIATLTGLSPRTIDRHRDNIRKKLGLSNSKVNLTTYLLSLP